jgi:protein-S-isoprenylcysteine O-methyltransferase Ste14
MTPDEALVRQPERIDRRRLAVSLLAFPVFFALFMFLPAGDWAWAKGWLFILVFAASAALASLYVWRVNPDLFAARINARQGTKRWDAVLIRLFFLTFLAIFPVAALDDGRFHWSPVPWWVCALGYVVYLAGFGIVTWAQGANRFFEPTVRIQADRGHRVIDTGPYALVRHPGYVGGSLFALGIPLCLGSLWALIPAGLLVLLLILRTRWEDQTLQAELSGYKEYAGRVRWKWVPGVW